MKYTAVVVEGGNQCEGMIVSSCWWGSITWPS